MSTGLNNLKVYKMAEELELAVFKLTQEFPSDEKYRSVDQLRRSPSSVKNNIAESYNKKSIKEKIRILRDIAKCEAEETKSNLILCFKKGFHTNPILAEQYTDLIKALSGYVRFIKLQAPVDK